MLKRAILVFFALSLSWVSNSQVIEEYYFGTFEDGTLEGFVNATVVNNPGVDSTNPSEKVLHYTGGAWWGPSKWKDNGHFTNYHSKLRVDVYLPQGALQNYNWSNDNLCMFILHTRNCASGGIDHWQSETKLVYTEQTWITIEFDLGSLEHFCYRNLILASSSTVGFYGDNFRWVMDLPDYDDEIIFAEKFEGSSFPPQGWTVFSTANHFWQRSRSHNHNPLGWYSAVHHQVGFDPVQSWLISPPIQIPENGDYEISFFSLNENSYWYSPAHGKANSVWVSTQGSDPQQDDFQKIWEAPSVGGSWEQSIVSLHEYSGQEIFIAFVYQGNVLSHSWFLDNIAIYEGEPKAIVNAQGVEDCAGNYITINLELENSMPTTAFQFDVELAEGFSYIEGSASLHRHSNHQVRTNMISSNVLRIIAYSANNSPFIGNSGLVLSFDVHASIQQGTYILPFVKSIVSDLQGKNVLFRAYPAPLLLTTPTTSITHHPASQDVGIGDNVNFQVVATGENLSYQWFFNNNPIEQATQPVLSLSNVNLSQNGDYYCLVTGDCGVIKSDVASLTVTEILYQVNFRVQQGVGVPVENAAVAISQLPPLFTNDAGEAFISLPRGNYPYTVSKDGFQIFSGLFFVTNNNVLVNVNLLPVSVDSPLHANTKAFPNPFSNSISVENAQWATSFSLSDINGKIVLSGQLPATTNFTIDTSGLNHGLYLLTLEGKYRQKVTFKLQKQ